MGARDEFLAVVLADPELLDLAFAEVFASWEADPPRPPGRTLVATAERRIHGRRRGERPVTGQCWPAWLRADPPTQSGSVASGASMVGPL